MVHRSFSGRAAGSSQLGDKDNIKDNIKSKTKQRKNRIEKNLFESQYREKQRK